MSYNPQKSKQQQKRRSHLPQNVQSQWTQIFNEVKPFTVPFKYLTKMIIELREGEKMIFHFDEKRIKKTELEALEQNVKDFINEYNDDILVISGAINYKKVSSEISALTKSYFS